MDDFDESMQKLGFPEHLVNRKPLDSTQNDCTEEIIQFRRLNFQDWCWNDKIFNLNPIFHMVHQWLGKEIPGFTFQIVLQKELMEKMRSGFFIRVDQSHADKLHRAMANPDPRVKLR